MEEGPGVVQNQCSPPSSFGAQVGEEDKAPVLETFRKLFEALFIYDVRVLQSHYMNGVTVQKNGVPGHVCLPKNCH